MPKNSKTMGLIPRGYGLAVNTHKKTIIFSPSRFAEGVVLLLPESYIKKIVKEYSDYSYNNLKEKVKKVHGSYNLLRQEGLKFASAGGTVTTGIVKSRRDGRKRNGNGFRNPTVYNTAVKGIQTLEEKINPLFDIACGCEDYINSKVSDESREFSIACAHISALIQSYQWGDYVDLKNDVRYCKPLKEGEIESPYDFRNNENLLVKYLEMRYIEKKKLFDIDRYLLNDETLITKPFRDGIDESIVTFNCIKDCENYSTETKYFMDYYSKILFSLGERTGIALENNKCVWNFKINDKLDIRLIPQDDSVNLMRIVYDNSFIKKIEDSNDEIIKDYWHLPITIDPMRKKKRIFAISEYLTKDELKESIHFFS